MISADHFENTWALYLSILNVKDPNSPAHFEPLMCVCGKDNWDVILECLPKVLHGENGLVNCFTQSVLEVNFPPNLRERDTLEIIPEQNFGISSLSRKPPEPFFDKAGM